MIIIMDFIKRIMRRREGQKIIEDFLLKEGLKMRFEIVISEINSLINTKLFDPTAINIYSSAVGSKIQFYIKGPNPEGFSDCEIFDPILDDRLIFKWNCWRKGLKTYNYTEVPKTN